jgi:hypothetical protein
MSGRRPLRAEDVRRLRLGPGANCSSVGSVVDTLFATAAVSAAVFAAVVAALGSEPVRVAGGADRDEGTGRDDDRQATGREDRGGGLDEGTGEAPP